jgi:hypothetical protein
LTVGQKKFRHPGAQPFAGQNGNENAGHNVNHNSQPCIGTRAHWISFSAVFSVVAPPQKHDKHAGDGNQNPDDPEQKTAGKPRDFPEIVKGNQKVQQEQKKKPSNPPPECCDHDSDLVYYTEIECASCAQSRSAVERIWQKFDAESNSKSCGLRAFQSRRTVSPCRTY